MQLSETGEKIFKLKYAKENETWSDTCLRVAWYVASIEEEPEKWAAEFFKIIHDLYFLPGGRILANAGTGIKNLMNCFVLPVEDSRKDIYKSLSDAAELFAWGGGVGYNFSNIREKGSDIITTGGKASGPLVFMSLFDQTGEVIKQASRRGAQMGVLDISHPDIINFIKFKSDLNERNKRLVENFNDGLWRFIGNEHEQKDVLDTAKILEKVLSDDQLTHFNISVNITDDFMQKVLSDGNWELISPKTGEVKNTVRARDLLKLIAEKAWESGDPGVLFHNRTNEDNMVDYLGDLRATNPCGEVPLLDYEPCCLGSINLHRFYNSKNNTFEWNSFEYVTRIATRFLDNIQELSETTIPEVNIASKELRRLGLGVMGFADLLAELEIPYDSQQAFRLADRISWVLSYFSILESMNLSQERGSFPKWHGDIINFNFIDKVLNDKNHSPKKIDMNDVRKLGLRNVATTSIAPTGTIALLAGINSSIEPFFALAYKRNVTSGIGNKPKEILTEFNPIFRRKLNELNLSKSEYKKIEEIVLSEGSIQKIPDELIPRNLKESFLTSHDISWRNHIIMQSKFQKYVGNAVSKTINMPNNSTVEDIYEAIIFMWQQKLKGGTIYRDGSKNFQILNRGNK